MSIQGGLLQPNCPLITVSSIELETNRSCLAFFCPFHILFSSQKWVLRSSCTSVFRDWISTFVLVPSTIREQSNENHQNPQALVNGLLPHPCPQWPYLIYSPGTTVSMFSALGLVMSRISAHSAILQLIWVYLWGAVCSASTIECGSLILKAWEIIWCK